MERVGLYFVKSLSHKDELGHMLIVTPCRLLSDDSGFVGVPGYYIRQSIVRPDGGNVNRGVRRGVRILMKSHTCIPVVVATL